MNQDLAFNRARIVVTGIYSEIGVSVIWRPASRFEYGLFKNPATTGVLVGHALAHEIGHVLEGFSRHSETGLMKERWSTNEVLGMRDRWLHFADYDKELILEGFGIIESSQTRNTENAPRKATVNASEPSTRIDEDKEIRVAATKSVQRLEAASVAWFDRQSCVSRHHQDLPLMVLGLARRRGIRWRGSWSKASHTSRISIEPCKVPMWLTQC
jgi:hypothetical protein